MDKHIAFCDVCGFGAQSHLAKSRRARTRLRRGVYVKSELPSQGFHVSKVSTQLVVAEMDSR